MANLNQNVYPYYDDFDGTKNFKRVLFRPSFAVQARELTQLQTNLSEQIKNISLPVLENGESLIPGELRWSKSVPSISLTINSSGGYLENSYTITDTTSNNYLIGKYIHGKTSNAIAKVIGATAAGQNTAMDISLLPLSGTFSATEDLHIYNQTESSGGTSGLKIGVCGSYSTNPANQAVVYLKEGTFNINGYSVYSPSQILITKDTNIRIGFNVVESFVTESDDSSLLDNSSGTTNHQAPGADRYKISLTLASKQVDPLAVVSTLVTADENFIELAKFDSFGNFIDITSNYNDNLVQKQDLKDLVHDDNGDYLDQAPTITLKDDSPSNVTVGISGGSGFINGNEIQFSNSDIELTKPSSSKTLDGANSWSGVSVPFVQSNYVQTQGGISFRTDVAPNHNWAQWWEFDAAANTSVNLKKNYDGATASDLVATARIKNIETAPSVTILQVEEENYTDTGDGGGTTPFAWIPGELIKDANDGAWGRLIKVETKVVDPSDDTTGDESMLLHIEKIHGYFTDSMKIEGYTSGGIAKVGQVTTNDGFHYEEFQGRDEFKFYLYDLKFQTNNTTKELYKLEDATTIHNGGLALTVTKSAGNFKQQGTSTAITATPLSTNGTGLKLTYTQPNAPDSSPTVVITDNGTGYKVNDTLTITDPLNTSTSITLTVATINEDEIAQLDTNISYLNTSNSQTLLGPTSHTDFSNLTNMGWPTQLLESSDNHGKDDTLTTFGDSGPSLLVKKLPKDGISSAQKVTIDKIRVTDYIASSNNKLTVSPPTNHTFGVDSNNKLLEGYDDFILYGQDGNTNAWKFWSKDEFKLTFASNTSVDIELVTVQRTLPVDDGKQTSASPPVNNTGEVTQTTLASDSLAGSYAVIFSCKRSTETNSQTSKTLNPFTETKFKTSTDVNKDILSLSKTDALPSNFKVYQMLNFGATQNAAGALATNGGVDITDRYEMDTGQRDSTYELASLRLKDPWKSKGVYPNGALLVVYYYWAWGSTGDFISSDSYFSTETKYSNGLSVANSEFTLSSDLPAGVKFESKRLDANGNPEIDKLFPEDIPAYISETTGEKITLTDAIDFRINLGSDGVTAFHAYPVDSSVNVKKLVYKEPKNISIFLDKSGNFKTTTSSSQSFAHNFENHLPICDVLLPGNIFNKNDIVVKPIEIGKRKALDIGKLEKVIEELDRNPNSNVDTVELELGRVKREVFSDNFTGHNKADVSDKEYTASIDLRRGELRPGYTQKSLKTASTTTATNSYASWTAPTGSSGSNISYGYIGNGSTLTKDKTYKIVTYAKSDDLSNLGAVNQQGEIFVATSTGTATTWSNGTQVLELPTKGHSLVGGYANPTDTISDFMNLQSNESMDVKSSDISPSIGTMQLEPSFSLYKSEKSPVDVIVDKNGIYDSLKYEKDVETIWDDWKLNWHGDNLKQLEPSTDDSSSKGYISSLMSSSYDSNSNTKVFKDKRLSLDYVPYMKSEKISVTVHGLKPSQDDYIFTFDGVDYTKVVAGEITNSTSGYNTTSHPYIVDSSTGAYKLKADKKGKLAFTFTPPNEDEGIVYLNLSSGGTGTFSSGDKVWQLYESDTTTLETGGYIRTNEYNLATGEVIWHDTQSNILALKNVSGSFSASTGDALNRDERIRNETNTVFHDFASYHGSKRHIVGNKNLKVSESTYNSKASATFHATGLPDNDLSTRNLETSEKGQLDNSIVQIIKPKKDMRLDKLDLYFSAKDDLATNTENLGSTVDNRPVILQIRTVKDGKASEKILPFSTVIKEDVTNLTGDSATTFEFNEYITLFKDVKYAITVISSGDYKLRVLDTYKNSGTKPSQFESFWRGNKKYSNKVLKVVLYSTKHASTTTYLDFVTEQAPDIVLPKNSISTKVNTDYLTIRLPGHGFKTGDTMKLSNIVGRTETVVNIPTSGAGTIAPGDKVYLNGLTANSDGSYNGPWGYIIKRVNSGTVTLTIAMVSGAFGTSNDDKNIVCVDSGGTQTGTGAISTIYTGLADNTDRYFAGVLVNNSNEKSLEKVVCTVSSDGLTVDEFRLIPSGIAISGTFNEKFRRSGIVSDSGAITLTSTPPIHASQIYYSGRMISNGSASQNDKRTFNHLVTGGTAYGSTLNGDTYLDIESNISSSLSFRWNDTRDANDVAADLAPFIDRKTVSANVIKNLSSSNYISRKQLLKKPANSVRVMLDAFVPTGGTLKVYIKTSTATSQGKFEDNSWFEVRPDTLILNDDSGFNSYQFTNDNLSDYGIYQIKLVMSSTDTTKVVRVKNLKVIPNKLDNSLKPMQVATVQINKFVAHDTLIGNRDEITIPCDFVVENAVCIVSSAQDNNATSYDHTQTPPTMPMHFDRAWAIGSDIKKYADGSIFPAYSHKQTGCVVRFWKKVGGASGEDLNGDSVAANATGAPANKARGYNISATILMFGRK
tara:strand:+ start:23196 stop:30434 length:7239 start_codon:yes stop_codon:yes gene_type:complete